MFEEDKVVGRRTGKMNREARQMRLSESDLSLTRDLVQQVSFGRLVAQVNR